MSEEIIETIAPMETPVPTAPTAAEAPTPVAPTTDLGTPNPAEEIVTSPAPEATTSEEGISLEEEEMLALALRVLVC